MVVLSSAIVRHVNKPKENDSTPSIQNEIVDYNKLPKDINNKTQNPKSITEQDQDPKEITDMIDLDQNKEGDDDIQEVFLISEIDDSVRERIYGLSYKSECPIPLSKLRFLTLTYYGFDEKTHTGEMIVHEELSEDVIEIFRELYENKYPIEKIRLIDEYEADDNKSMEDNNTSCFCYRTKTSGNSVSMHGYGLAIDINPMQNPYVYKNLILPEGSNDYVDRSKNRKGMIIKEDICYQAFIKRGWTWGGNWKKCKDYQHFEKELENTNHKNG